jgi:AcrR family transcriptional regulator
MARSATTYDRAAVVQPESLRPVADPADTARVESTRSRLLAAAYELLLNDGYHATTVQAIARRAGLTTGAIYANFANKQELMALAVLERWSQLEQNTILLSVSSTDRSSLPDGASERLAAYLAQHIVAPASPEHQLLTEVTGAVLRDGGEISPLFTGVQVIENTVRASIEQAKAEGEIDPGLDTGAIVALVLNVYLGAITSKSWGLPQPKLEDTLKVITAVQRGLALPLD